jgi:hypothetical protein
MEEFLQWFPGVTRQQAEEVLHFRLFLQCILANIAPKRG